MGWKMIEKQTLDGPKQTRCTHYVEQKKHIHMFTFYLCTVQQKYSKSVEKYACASTTSYAPWLPALWDGRK